MPEPELQVRGENVVITDEEGGTELLLSPELTEGVEVPQGLEDVRISAAGLVGRDESGWVFGTTATAR